METSYLGVVLTDDYSCANDVERAELAYFKQFNSINHKFSFVDQKSIASSFLIAYNVFLRC